MKAIVIDGGGEVMVMVGMQLQARKWISNKSPWHGFINLSQNHKAVLRDML